MFEQQWVWRLQLHPAPTFARRNLLRDITSSQIAFRSPEYPREPTSRTNSTLPIPRKSTGLVYWLHHRITARKTIGVRTTVQRASEDQFCTHAGYNEWAESNNIIILYPQ